MVNRGLLLHLATSPADRFLSAHLHYLRPSFMFKLSFSAIAVLGISGVMTVLAHPVLAQEQVEVVHDPLGLCNLYPLSGHAIIDTSGNLVTLPQYCQALREIEKSGSSPFWQAFLAAGNREAIAFAHTLEQKEVIAYSQTICPFLQGGGTLDDLRRIQSGGELPAEFEVAITIAAINVYCPAYRSEIGR